MGSCIALVQRRLRFQPDSYATAERRTRYAALVKQLINVLLWIEDRSNLV
jgi:hypothetical protein